MSLYHGLIFFRDLLIAFFIAPPFRHRADISGDVDFSDLAPLFLSLMLFSFHCGLCDPAGGSNVLVNRFQLFFSRLIILSPTERPDIGRKAVRPQDIRSSLNVFPVNLFDLVRF